jgi:thiamine transport system ATP-binding protein
MLSLDDVSVAFGGLPVVDHVDLELSDGQVLAVLGPSGCGKSTLLRAIAGLEPLTSGAIRWDGADLAGVPTHRRGFVLMFQDGQLFEHLDVARNVGYALRGPDRQRRIAELLELVGLEGYADRAPATLSGGERQRVALARSLAASPRLLLLDEPLSALDAGLRERLAGDLRDILVRAGTTALLVTHDHEEAFTVADRLAVMRQGRVVQSGDLDEVWRAPVDPDTALFLGYSRVLTGDAARRLLSADTVALRRSALVLDDSGPLEGVVLQARVTPDQVRLVVETADLGTVDAVAALDARPVIGAKVRLRLDPSKVAIVGQSLD